MDLRDRSGAIGPKRILAIDGGGIRRLISLGFLEQIETLLRERHNNPDLMQGQSPVIMGKHGDYPCIILCQKIYR